MKFVKIVKEVSFIQLQFVSAYLASLGLCILVGMQENSFISLIFENEKAFLTEVMSAFGVIYLIFYSFVAVSDVIKLRRSVCHLISASVYCFINSFGYSFEYKAVERILLIAGYIYVISAIVLFLIEKYKAKQALKDAAECELDSRKDNRKQGILTYSVLEYLSDKFCISAADEKEDRKNDNGRKRE